MTTNAYTTNNATTAGATCVRLQSGNILSYMTSSTSYGLLPNTTYRYIITYKT